MIVFADTNWLEALYLEPTPDEKAAVQRARVAERHSRKFRSLTTSPIVLLETRNVFSRQTGKAIPGEWEDLVSDFNGKIFVDPMNWDRLRDESFRIIEKYAAKSVLGTFDVAIVASAILAGAREFLTFDERLAAVGVALGMKVFPELTPEGRAALAKLRS